MRAVVDRIEGEIAVLLLGDEEVRLDLPMRYLPTGVKEGTILSLRFEVDAAATDAARERAVERIRRLKRLSGTQA